MDLIHGLIQTFLSFWWLWLFCILAPTFKSAWLSWRRVLYDHETEFILFEITVPRITNKSPRAMEQVLAAIHALRNVASDPAEVYYEGEETRNFSLEMVSLGGEVHFYIRIYKIYRDLVQAAFYSFYQDIELVEVEDYTSRFPENLKETYRYGYNTWGTEMILAREDAYPIKTFDDFFSSPDEEEQFDPISAFLEILAKARTEELVGIQIIIRPTDPHWHLKFQDLADKLKERRPSKEAAKAGVNRTVAFPGGPLPAFGVEAEKKEQDWGSLFLTKSPGETEILEALENKLSKQAFETVIRFVYFSPNALFYDSYPRRSLAGIFNQYAALDLNYFRQNLKTATRVKIFDSPYLFPGLRLEYRKQRIVTDYRRRQFPYENWVAKVITSYFMNWNIHSKKMLLSTEEIATLFHPPTSIVLTAPHMKRVESRKGGPPAGLAIFGQEEDIDFLSKKQ